MNSARPVRLLSIWGAVAPLLLWPVVNGRAQTVDSPLGNVAQEPAPRADAVRFLLPALDSAQPPRPVDAALVPALQRSIALDLRGVTRERALAEIGRAAGLSVVYASEVIPRAGSVVLTNRAISVSDAFRTILAGLPIDVLVGEHGTVILLTRPPSPVAVFTGVVVDSVSRTPVRLAAVRFGGGTETVLTDDAGRFHFTGSPGALEVDVRRIGFRPASMRVTPTPGATTTILLAPTPVGLPAVAVGAGGNQQQAHAAEEVGRGIITAAIERKKNNRTGLHDYRYDAHVLIVDHGQPHGSDSVGSILLWRESVVAGYWESSGRIQQTVVARRDGQSKGEGIPLRPTDGLIEVRVLQEPLGEMERIEDFNDDRWLVLGMANEPVPSPIADDALKHYSYSVLDTVVIDGRRALRLSIKPSSVRTAAFDGIIDIADSTFDILAVDVGINQPRDENLEITNLGVRLRFADVGDGRWMPVSITTSIRGWWFKRKTVDMDVAYTATLGNFRFNEGSPPSRLDEYPFVVAKGADQADPSVYANAPQVPLTPAEAAQIDSGTSPTVRKSGDGSLVPSTDYLDVRFDRVDGWRYWGGGSWQARVFDRSMTPTAKLGYAFGAKRWAYQVGDQLLLSPGARVSIGALYHDETMTLPVLTSDRYNPSLGAVLAGAGADRLGYYRERGSVTSLSTRLIQLAQLNVSYTDARQSSLPVLSRYATSSGGRYGLIPPPNAPIQDGRWHALSASINYDSRPLFLQPHGYQPLTSTGIAFRTGSFTDMSLETELSAPATFGGDFNYRRYILRLGRTQELGSFGSTHLSALAATATGNLPPQRYFDFDGGAVLSSKNAPFSTLGDSTYGGNRAAAVILEHTFAPSLLRRSDIPTIRDLPLDFAVHAAAFWSTFTPGAIIANGSPIRTAPSAYRELGFTVGYRIPFIGLELAARVGRQLSRYPTKGTRVTIGTWD